MPTSKANQLAATAHHEAGHAVAAIMKFVRFDRVTIIPDGDALGHIRYLRPGRGVVTMHNRGMVAMAGDAAQRRFRPRSVRRHHGAGDRASVVDYAVQCAGSQAQAALLVKLWDVQACEFVELRWTMIERVAAGLLDHQMLDEDGVRALCFPMGAEGARDESVCVSK